MDEHSQANKPKKSIRVELLVIAITLLGLLALLAVGPVTERVKTVAAARKLRDPDSRVWAPAGAELLTHGAPGRVALLRAMETDNAARVHLKEALFRAVAEDVRAGRNVEPMVQAAAAALHRGAKYPKDYARLAAAGWALGLLDEQTKREIIALALEIRLTVRPEYPLGKGMPSLSVHWSPEPVSGRLPEPVATRAGEDSASPLRFSITGIFTIDGQSYVTGPAKMPEEGGYGLGCGSPVKNLALGKHTVQAKAEAILTGIVDKDGKPVTSPEIGWKTTIETPVTTVTVRDDLPSDFLQAKATPELSAQIAKAVKTRWDAGPSGYGLGRRNERKASLSGQHNFVIDPPLPVDLAYKEHWKVVETGEEFSGHVGVLPQGKKQGTNFVPSEWMEKLPVGNHKFTFQITLEPDLDAAIRNPDVKGYWPLPIELPPIMYEIEVKKVDN